VVLLHHLQHRAQEQVFLLLVQQLLLVLPFLVA
jgi:hypothetical protein